MSYDGYTQGSSSLVTVPDLDKLANAERTLALVAIADNMKLNLSNASSRAKVLDVYADLQYGVYK